MPYEAAEMPKQLEKAGNSREMKKGAPRCLVGGSVFCQLTADQGRESCEIEDDGTTAKTTTR